MPIFTAVLVVSCGFLVAKTFFGLLVFEIFLLQSCLVIVVAIVLVGRICLPHLGDQNVLLQWMDQHFCWETRHGCTPSTPSTSLSFTKIQLSLVLEFHAQIWVHVTAWDGEDSHFSCPKKQYRLRSTTVVFWWV